MIKLYFKLLALSILVLLSSLAIDWYYRDIYDLNYHIPKNILPAPEIEDKYDLVKLGNSHATDGITFEHYNIKALELAGAGQELRYDLAFLKQYSNQIEDGAVILIPVTPISFSQKPASKDTGLHRVYYGRISPFYLPYFEVGEYLQTELFHFMRAGFLLREKNQESITSRIADENSREKDHQNLEEIPKQDSTSPTSNQINQPLVEDRSAFDYKKVSEINLELEDPQTGDSKRLEESMHFMFAKWYNLEDFNPIYFDQNRADLEAIIKFSLDQGWRPVLLTIPISQVLEVGLADDYKQVYIYDQIAKTDLQEAPYWDFSADPVPKMNADLFSNSDHLTKKGARLFSYILLQKLIDEGYLDKAVDGYEYD